MSLPARWCAALLTVLSLVSVTACQEDEDAAVRVTGLEFEGNEAFDDAALREVVATKATGWLPWAPAEYFNRQTFEADLDRLRRYYADRGYPSAVIETVDVALNETRDEVSLRVVIDEGAPLLVEGISVIGLEQVPESLQDEARSLPLSEGQPLDRRLLVESREQVSFLLHDRGYPAASVDVRQEPGSAPDRIQIVVAVTPGEPMRFGELTMVGLTDLDRETIQRTLAFEPGDLYRESLVLESQRRLVALGMLDFAHVAPSSAEQPAAGEQADVDEAEAAAQANGRARALTNGDVPGPAASGAPPSVNTSAVSDQEAQAAAVAASSVNGAVPMTITVVEGRPTSLRVGVGYGSEDGPRGALNWQHSNFLGQARQLSLDGKYSLRLRDFGVDLVQPYVVARAVSLRARAGASWATEPNYTARRVGGRGSIEYRGRRSRGPARAPLQHIVRGTYVNEALEYHVNEETLADVTELDELVVLGFDPVTGSGSGRLSSFDVDLERSVLDSEIDARKGYTVRLHLEYASPALGGSYRYDEVLAEGRTYVPLGRLGVWATRVRSGSILADTARDVPFSERYFLGGATSLRGWGRFQVAPLTSEGLPVGGLSMFEASTELRFPIAGAFGAVAFIDAGEVWSEASDVQLSSLKTSVGPGLRYTSPVGVVRLDFGYQLTPIEGLVLGNAAERRRWRIHLSIGEAF